ncbi:tRNA synthetases class I-domain-containing protein [Suillus fuscotomentosus]|uniref:valine--tRNA ligase n=1 Tax=Suillus fuscotomentosus TaxID=1912939 RepID=A0AAD4E9N9_9AGAM|nr:tRNA synthetases class I-domain-containing protein [Suillus fuscotomentosus]KAG1902229.1 tRNA synthetases class I-domain-containing protein [Suillus fuscotomentosus]
MIVTLDSARPPTPLILPLTLLGYTCLFSNLACTSPVGAPCYIESFRPVFSGTSITATSPGQATLSFASKSSFVFVNSDSDEGAQINNIIVITNSVGPLIIRPPVNHPNVTIVWANFGDNGAGNANALNNSSASTESIPPLSKSTTRPSKPTLSGTGNKLSTNPATSKPSSLPCPKHPLWHLEPIGCTIAKNPKTSGKNWVMDRTLEKATKQAKILTNGENFTLKQDEDVLDTWFSSGLWPFSILGWPEKARYFVPSKLTVLIVHQQTINLSQYYPASILETGWDILSFWVVRMVLMGIYLTWTDAIF